MKRRDIFGWLAPSGRFVECKTYEHLDVAKKDEEFQKVEKVRELLETLHEIHEDCADLERREGLTAGEWHCYEMACDDARHKIVNYLYRAGFIRVGAVGDALHFEGFPDRIRVRHQECKDFAESYGACCVFEPIR